ncbi:MAG: hypothetical protein WCT16_04340 [Candidatus Buchananbacteria bacterium]
MRAVKRGIKGNLTVRIFLSLERLKKCPGFTKYFDIGTLRLDSFLISFYEGRFWVDGHNGACPEVFDQFIEGYSIKKVVTDKQLKRGRYFGKQFGDAVGEVEEIESPNFRVTVEGTELNDVFGLFDAINNPRQKWADRTEEYFICADFNSSKQQLTKTESDGQPKKNDKQLCVLLNKDERLFDVEDKTHTITVSKSNYTLHRVKHPVYQEDWLVIEGTKIGAPEQHWRELKEKGQLILI